MDDHNSEPTAAEKPYPYPYISTGHIEAHIIADMLRIESITTELREFKTNTNSRLDEMKLDTNLKLARIESWLTAIIGVTITTLLSVVVGIFLSLF